MNNSAEFLKECLDMISDITRFILPAAAFIILIACTVSLLRNRPRVTTMAHLKNLANGDDIPLAHWETSIGRSNSCDICLSYTTVSRFHAVIARRKGKWMIYDTQSKPGILINNEKIDGKAELFDGDNIVLGTAVLTFLANDASKREPASSINEDEKNNAYYDYADYSENNEYYDYNGYSDISSVPEKLVNESQNIYLPLNDSPAIIGSASDAELYCSAPGVAPYHARMSCGRNGWTIENINPKAGVWINGVPLESTKLLFNNDEIVLGRLKLTFYDKYSD